MTSGAGFRMEFLLRLKTGGLWGSWEEGLEAHTRTQRVMVEGREVVGVPPTYIKGLLRKASYTILHHLERLGVVSGWLSYVRLFGSSPFERGVPGRADSRPSCLRLSHAIVVDETEARRIVKRWAGHERGGGGEALERALDETYLEAHVRLSDASERASEGGLFVEERVPPGLYVYGVLELACPDLVVEGARLLAFSFAALAYSTAGRRTVVEPCVHVEGLDDEHVSSVVQALRRWCPG